LHGFHVLIGSMVCLMLLLIFGSMVCLMLLLILVYFILLDELIMGCSQIRVGPFNLGLYGLFSSVINGCNLVISQFILPLVLSNNTIGFQSFPVCFFLLSFFNYIMINPFFFVDVYLSLILVILVSSFSIFFIILLAFEGLSKYSMLGCFRLISQLISFELLTSTIVLFFGFSFNDLSIGTYYFIIDVHSLLWFIYLAFIYFFSFISFFCLVFFSLAVLAETNRVPFDLSESESELVAGFITEYSSVYYSIIVLTEYANIIALSLVMIILNSIPDEVLLWLILLISITRSTLLRVKFDELMTNVWIILLPILFSKFTFYVLLCSFFIISSPLLPLVHTKNVVGWLCFFFLNSHKISKVSRIRLGGIPKLNWAILNILL